jgi:hypothetical protein
LPRTIIIFDSVLFTVLEQCKVWFCILTLTQDDEQIVRIELNSKLNVKQAVCDRKSLELFVDLFLETVLSQHTLEGLVLLVGLILRDDFDIKLTESEEVTPDYFLLVSI